MRTKGELTQELLEWRLTEMLCMEERRKELDKTLDSFNRYQGAPLVKTLDEALTIRNLLAERAGVVEEMKALAGDMLSCGIPEQVWFLTETIDGKAAKLKVYESNGRPWYKLEIAP